jgi:hypothetical protein
MDTDGPQSPALEDAGLRRAGRRALTPAERRVVRRRSWWLRASFAVAALLFWIVLFVALGTGVFIEEAQGAARVVLIGVTLLLFGGTVILFLAARDLLRDGRALARDVGRGYVQRFSGTLSAEAESAPRFRPLYQVGLLKRDPTAVQWLEVLPRSGVLWQANGARPRRWLLLMPPEPVEVAETPAFAAVAAEWTEPDESAATPTRVGQRELSVAEVRELRQQIRRVLRLRLVWIVPCNLWFWTVVALGLREGRLPRGSGWAFWHDVATFCVLGLAAIAGDVVLVRSLQEAWKLARDTRIGRVVIARCPLEDDEAPEAMPPGWITLELLPVSEAVWTIDGEPAAWRVAD